MPSQEVAMVGVSAYRQLLRKLRTAGGAAPTEDSAAALQQAKERVLLRLSARRELVQRDPRRAFARLRDELARLREVKDSAKDSIREAGAARAARLRSAYDILKQKSLRAVAARGRDEVEVLGSNGPLRVLVLSSVLAASKLFMRGLSRLSVEGKAILTAAQARPQGQPLITVSNHVAAMDDPLLLAALTPMRAALEHGCARWSLCATDRCFKNGLMSAFFRAGKVLPVERGRGMDQAGMRAAESRLAAGDWVHIFPEGTRSPDGRSLGAVRAGVGRLVASCEAPPLVVPILHSGMERVMPRGAKLPLPGHQVRVLVGEPIPVEDLLQTATLEQWPETRLYRAIAGRISDSMTALKAQLDGTPLPATASAAAAGAAMDGPQMLPLIEDQLDADSHSWTDTHSLRQSGGLAPLTARVRASAAAGSLLAGAVEGLRMHPLLGAAPAAPPLRALAGSAAEYARARLAHVSAMLAPAGLQPAFAL